MILHTVSQFLIHAARLTRPSVTYPGIVSIVIGLVSFWFIPNFPSNTGTYFLTAEEAEMAAYRQTVSAGGISEDEEGGSWGGVWAMLKDPFSHFFAFIHFSIIIAQSYKDFFPSVRFSRSRATSTGSIMASGPLTDSSEFRSSQRWALMRSRLISFKLPHLSSHSSLLWRCRGIRGVSSNTGGT